MAPLTPRLISQDYRVNQLILLTICCLMALAGLPFFLLHRNAGFATAWYSALVVFNVSFWVRPARTVFAGTEGLVIKAFLHRTVVYPPGAFAEVRNVRGRWGRTKADLAFADGRQYPVVFTQPIERSYIFIFEDFDETQAALTRYVRAALAEFHPAPATNRSTT